MIEGIFRRKIYNSFYGNIRFNERRIFMSIAERRLSNKIRMFEDMLLRSKNNYAYVITKNAICKGVLTRALFFLR